MYTRGSWDGVRNGHGYEGLGGHVCTYGRRVDPTDLRLKLCETYK